MIIVKQYLKIIRPGIIFGNLISVIGGFLLGAKGKINYILFFNTLVGVSLVIASGCVFNNYIDRDIDIKMERTKNRVSLKKELISPQVSLVYAIILGIIGFTILYIKINQLAMWLAVIGFTIYVAIYSMYIKRKSIYSTLIGSLSGATPPIIGYCAVRDQFDICALILLLIFSLWQMPHFYAIAIFRFTDYLAASIPVLPVKYGILVTKYHITLYIIGFMIANMILTFSGYVGYKHLIVITSVSAWWLYMSLQGYKFVNNDIAWARKMFIFSIFILIILTVMISLDSLMMILSSR